MSTTMNRRAFLKTTAAAAVAVSLTGLLGGCNEAQPLATAQIPGFDIALTNVKVTGGKVYNTPNGESVLVEAVFNLTYTGTGTMADSFTNIFSSSIGETALDLKNNGTLAVGNSFPFSRTKTCTVTFAKEAEGINTAFAEGTPLILNVKLSNQTASFAYDCKGTAAVK